MSAPRADDRAVVSVPTAQARAWRDHVHRVRDEVASRKAEGRVPVDLGAPEVVQATLVQLVEAVGAALADGGGPGRYVDVRVPSPQDLSRWCQYARCVSAWLEEGNRDGLLPGAPPDAERFVEALHAHVDGRCPLRGEGLASPDAGELLALAPDALLLTSASGLVRSANEAALRLLGDGLEGRRLADLLPGQARTLLGALLPAPPGTPVVVEHEVLRADGSVGHAETVAVDRLDDTRVRGIVLSLRDVTARRARDRRASWLGTHDPLTGLPNRVLLRARLRDALRRWGADGRHRPGVLLVDLDGFKQVNDERGHRAGDEVLRAVALRLQARVRPSDLVCRLGGDEFVVLVGDAAAPGLLDQLAAAVRDAVRGPISSRGGPQVLATRLDASVGAVLAQRGDDVDTVLDRADAAMYAAKPGATTHRPSGPGGGRGGS